MGGSIPFQYLGVPITKLSARQCEVPVQKIKQRICQFTGLKGGSFPFQYLGVPITKLSARQCEVPVQKIEQTLSMEQLTNTVLMGVFSFWVCLF